MNFLLLLQIYGIGGIVMFCIYLALFFQDPETPLSDKSSWLVLILGAAFWPIVLPISLQRELLPRWQARRWASKLTAQTEATPTEQAQPEPASDRLDA